MMPPVFIFTLFLTLLKLQAILERLANSAAYLIISMCVRVKGYSLNRVDIISTGIGKIASVVLISCFIS